MKHVRTMIAFMDELPVFVREIVGVIPAGEEDSVEEYHRHLVEKYDSIE